MTSKTRPEPPREERGFTLLEVLAAVLIFAMFAASVSTSAMLLLGAEGESERRLRASLLADQELALLEAQVLQGQVPPESEEEKELDEFLVRVDVEAFDPLAEWLGGAAQEAGALATGGLLVPGPGAGAGRRGAAQAPASPLRRIRVAVLWEEGFEERSVTRTTFALDREAASQLLQEAGLGQGPGEAGDAGQTSAPDSEDRNETGRRSRIQSQEEGR